MRLALALALGASLLAGPVAAQQHDWLGDGMWKIGGKHPAGVYIAPRWAKTSSTSCYVEARTKPFGGSVNIIDNDFASGKVTQYMRVEAGQWLYIDGGLFDPRGCRFFLR